MKVPEGFELDPILGGEFVTLMNDEAKTPAERAQGLIDLQAKAVKAMSEKAMADWDKLQTTWQGEMESDPEIGGDKLEANLSKISTLLNVHGTPELREVLNATGAGNHKEVARFLTKIANALGESLPAPANVPGSGERDPAKTMFPNMK